MLVGNEYLPCLRKVTPQSMPVTKKDLLDLASISPSDPFMSYLDICAYDLID